MVCRGGEGGGVLKVIQEFSQTARILKKEPAHHRLKSCGLSVKGGVLVSRPPSRPIPSAPHQVLLPGAEMGPQPFQSTGLGFRPHPGHDSVVEINRPSGGPTMLSSLVQLPHRIPQPGQLQDVEIPIDRQGGHGSQPVAGPLIRVP
jgi:hypothetical protein